MTGAVSTEHSERLVTGYSGRLLLSLSIGYLGIQFARNILSPLLPSIIEELGITPFQAGIALTLLSAMYALCMYPGGRLSDQLSRKSVLVAASAISILGFVLLTFAFSYGPFLIGVAIVGIGAGLYWISLRALLADLFVARRGQAFGFQDALGFAGPLIAAGGAVVILATTTWRSAFVPLIVLLGVVGVLAHFWIREPYALSWIEFDLRSTGVRVFGTREICWLVVAYSCVVFPMTGVIGFLPTFLQVEKGISATFASVGFGVLFIGAIVTMPVSGYLGDRISHVPVAVGGLVLAVGGLVALVFSSFWLPIGIGIFAFAAGVWAFPPVVQAYLMDRFPDGSMGGDFGAFKTIYAAVGSLGPGYIGFVAGMADYTLAFVSLFVFLFISIGVLLGLAR